MKKQIIIFGLLLFFVSGIISKQNLFAQEEDDEKVYVTDVKTRISSGKLIITYNIIDYNKVDLFYPTIYLYEPNGDRVDPENISGDVYRTVNGGNNKRITWYFAKDEWTEEEVNKLTAVVEVEQFLTKSYMIKRHLLLTTLYPGWGDYKIRDQEFAYFLYGVAGYGSIVAAILYNQKASDSYDDYLLAETIAVGDSKYSNARKFKTMSYIFAGTAVAIWALDITSGLVKINKKSKSYSFVEPGKKKLFIGYDYEPRFNQPMVSIKIKF